MIAGFEKLMTFETDSESVHTTEEILSWLKERKENQYVSINRISLSECTPWYYDESEGMIRNEQGSFFRISGIREYRKDNVVEQPIIIQDEIGFLGIICKQINGIWHFLMQAKIEPGNINYVQLSPTIQATKSNFTMKHGGRRPLYLDFFINMRPEDTLVDQIQSEQSSRFLGKRNRNVIIKTEEDIKETDSHKWLTLKQIGNLMKYDNLVNMDTRTVLSCLPLVFLRDDLTGYSDRFLRSVQDVERNSVIELYSRLNDLKMFGTSSRELVSLFSMKQWRMIENRFECIHNYPFSVIFCHLEIEGREVTDWNQPLFAAQGSAVFGLICCEDNGVLKLLVSVKPEIGCFDFAEIGPSVQEEAGFNHDERDSVASFFFEQLTAGNGIIYDVMLSEEGGRFYQEQNRNVIMMVDKDQLIIEKKKYVWVTIGTLDALTQINNCLNIQLRNLLSILYMHNN